MRYYNQNTTITQKSHNEGSKNTGNNHEETEDDVLLAAPKAKLQRPSFYKVVLLNDDYTPMDFVVKVLENIFHKDHTQAVSVMMQVHQKGAGLCGVFTRDVAETKVDQTLYLAQQHEYPLQCVMEKE